MGADLAFAKGSAGFLLATSQLAFLIPPLPIMDTVTIIRGRKPSRLTFQSIAPGYLVGILA